jgi:hypothetical protein
MDEQCKSQLLLLLVGWFVRGFRGSSVVLAPRSLSDFVSARGARSRGRGGASRGEEETLKAVWLKSYLSLSLYIYIY